MVKCRRSSMGQAAGNTCRDVGAGMTGNSSIQRICGVTKFSENISCSPAEQVGFSLRFMLWRACCHLHS